MFDVKKMQKMQKDLRDGLEAAQEDLANQTVEGSAGGGAVTVLANGNQKLTEIRISPEAVDPDDLEMLQDLVMAATNQALEKAKDLYQERVNQITGGANLPNIPFM